VTRIRIVLAEDHDLVRAGIRALLEPNPELEIVGEAANGSDAVALVEQVQPDVVLMDISMPVLNGLEATRQIVKLHPHPRVIVLSMYADKEFVREALIAGASGYVLKTADRRELELAILAVARGDAWLGSGIAHVVVEDVLERGEGEAPDELTPRQREVLQLIAEGHTTKEIARRLHVSVKTVETHRAQIMERLEIRHVAGLVRYAIRRRIVSPDK
jgi:DNA-binding NarL/FixJ family response regulator